MSAGGVTRLDGVSSASRSRTNTSSRSSSISSSTAPAVAAAGRPAAGRSSARRRLQVVQRVGARSSSRPAAGAPPAGSAAGATAGGGTASDGSPPSTSGSAPPPAPARRRQAGEHLRRRVALGRRRQQLRRGPGVPGPAQGGHAVGDEGEVLAVDVEGPLVDLHRLRPGGRCEIISAAMATVLAHRLVGEALLLVELGQLHPRAGVVGLELGHPLVDRQRRGGVVVLDVVVGEHLVLGARLVDQPLAVVQLGQPLVDLEPDGVELDDLLVDRDAL